MAKKQQKKGGISTGKVVAIGAGVAALGGAAYYLFGPNGKKNQKKAKAWMVKMEKDVANKAKKIKNMTMPMYHSVVEDVIKPYIAKNAPDAKEIKAYGVMLKKQWDKMKSMGKSDMNKGKMMGRKVKSHAKKVVGVVKKTVRKVSKEKK